MSSPPLSSLKSKCGVFASRTRTRTRTCAMVWPFSSNNDKASSSKNKDFRTLKQQRDDAFGATAEERIRRSQERRAETARMMKMSNEGWVDESESSSSNFFSKLFGGGGGGKQSSKKK